MEFTWAQIGLAAGSAVSFVVGLLGVAKFVADRFDIKFDRKEKSAEKKLTESAKLQEIEQAEHVRADNRLYKMIDLKDTEITRLEKKVERLEAKIDETESENQLSRPTVIALRRKLGELDKKLHSLLIQPCPDEVANILNERMGEAKVLATEIRDLLP